MRAQDQSHNVGRTYEIAVVVYTRPAHKRDPASFVIATTYPQGGYGVINLNESDIIQGYTDRRTEGR